MKGDDPRETLIVLGATRYQEDAVRAGRRLGFRVVTVDNVPSNPAHVLADASVDCDITSVEGVLEIARRECAGGVLAACTDVGVGTASRVARDLGLTAPPVGAADVLTDKVAFRRHLEGLGLSVPSYEVLPPDVDPELVSFEGPRAVLKPATASGSKGVVIVNNRRELGRHLPESRRFSRDGTCLLEEFVPGHQGTIEGFLMEGRLVFSLVMDRMTVAPPHVATIGHRVPSRLPDSVIDELQGIVTELFAGLGIEDGPLDCDFVVGPGGVRILEASPRLGGNGIQALVSAATGTDLMEACVLTAMGRPAQIDRCGDSAGPVGVHLLGVDRSGIVDFDIEAVKALREHESILSLDIDVRPGDTVEAFRNGRCRLGEFLVRGRDRDQLDDLIGMVLDSVKMRAS